MRSAAGMIETIFAPLGSMATIFVTAPASLGAEKAIAHHTDDDGDAQERGKAGQQHQPAHLVDDALRGWIERFFVVGRRIGHASHSSSAKKP